MRAGISDSGSIWRIMPWVETRWRIILSMKSGIKPVTVILGAAIAWKVEPFVETVALRSKDGGAWSADGREVHQIPKLAMERYMYFAGRVKDNVGVT